MKKLFIILFGIFLLISPVYADDMDIDLPSDDLWDNWQNPIDDGKETKPVSDAEFDKAIEQVDKKVNKWKNWAEKRKIPKGEEINQSNESELIDEAYGEKKTEPVILIPVELQIGSEIIPIGHYQVKGEVKDGKYFINLYQAHDMVASIPAVETEDDFNQDTISFANWKAEDEEYLKIEFGSMDFNAYAYVKILKD